MVKEYPRGSTEFNEKERGTYNETPLRKVTLSVINGLEFQVVMT